MDDEKLPADLQITEISTPPELNISAEKVCFIIIKANELNAKEKVIEPNPGSNPADMQQREILEDYADDPTYEELRDAIDGLNDDEKIDLVALYWIGRGYYKTEFWEEARNQAEKLHQHPEHRTSAYLISMETLGDFLEEGLTLMGHSCEEFEINRL